MQEFDLVIKHRSGKNNANADALSRNPIRSDKHPSSVLTAQSTEVELVSHTEELRKAQSEDKELHTLIAYVAEV